MMFDHVCNRDFVRNHDFREFRSFSRKGGLDDGNRVRRTWCKIKNEEEIGGEMMLGSFK